MEYTTTKEMAMSEICTRPWRGANTAHAGDFRSVQGSTVPVAGRRTAVATLAPITAVVDPRLEVPPV